MNNIIFTLLKNIQLSRLWSIELLARSELHNSVALLFFIERDTVRIRQALLEHKINPFFKFLSDIYHLFPSPKERLYCLPSNFIYSILCSCGAVYIGGRSIRSHLSEHKHYQKQILYHIPQWPNINKIRCTRHEFHPKRSVLIGSPP